MERSFAQGQKRFKRTHVCNMSVCRGRHVLAMRFRSGQPAPIAPGNALEQGENSPGHLPCASPRLCTSGPLKGPG